MDFKSRNEKLADDVRDSLNKCVNDLYEQREQYVKRPGHDFVRERILDFVTLIVNFSCGFITKWQIDII